MYKNRLVVMVILLFLVSGVVAAAQITIEELQAKVEQELASLQDFQGLLTIDQVIGERIEQVKMRVMASPQLGIARIEFIEPKILQGQIIVANQHSMKMRMYVPILRQIIVSNIEDAGADAGFALDLTDLSTVFDLQSLETELVEIISSDDGDIYLVRVNGLVDQTQYIRINQQFHPYQLTLYEGETI